MNDFIYKAYGFTSAKYDQRVREVYGVVEDVHKRFGYPTKVLFGDRDIEPTLRIAEPEAELVFDVRYAGQFWLGFPDKGDGILAPLWALDPTARDMVEETHLAGSPTAKARRKYGGKTRKLDDPAYVPPPSRFDTDSKSYYDPTRSYGGSAYDDYQQGTFDYDDDKFEGLMARAKAGLRPKPLTPKPLGTGLDHADLEKEVQEIFGADTKLDSEESDPDF